MNTKKFTISSVVIRVILLCAVFVCIIPIYFAGITSLKTMQEFYADVWALPTSFQWINYVNAVVTGRIGEYFFNSVFLAVSCIILIQFCGILCAYALARLKVPHAELCIIILLGIQILPTETVVIPLYMMMSGLKILKVTYMAQIIAYVGWSLPGTTIIMKNFFQTIPVELLESARIDGSSEMNTMVKVVLPLMKGSIMTCVVMNFSYVWGELIWAQIATLLTDKGIPLTVGLLNFQSEFGTQWPSLCAAILIVIIPQFIMFAFTQKYFVAGLTTGSVKG